MGPPGPKIGGGGGGGGAHMPVTPAGHRTFGCVIRTIIGHPAAGGTYMDHDEVKRIYRRAVQFT